MAGFAAYVSGEPTACDTDGNRQFRLVDGSADTPLAFCKKLNEVIKMEKMTRKHVLRAAKSSRYHSVLSTDESLGIVSPALKDGANVECLPRWKEYGQTDAVLSRRSLLVDIGMSDIQMDDVISTVDLLDKLREGTDAYRATHSFSG